MTIGVSLVLFLVLVLVFRGPIRISNWIRRIFQTHFPTKRDAEQNRVIYIDLVELRAVVEADRAYVFRFHNGSEFLPSHPAWKLSCTHEVVLHGVTYESARLQGILYSRIPNIVSPILTGTSSMTGVEIMNCGECQFQPKCASTLRWSVLIQVDEMEGSYCKFHLESQNIKSMILCGMSNGGKVFGFVGVDFCGTKRPTEKMKEYAERVCRAADRIHYYIQYKKVPGGKLIQR